MRLALLKTMVLTLSFGLLICEHSLAQETPKDQPEPSKSTSQLTVFKAKPLQTSECISKTVSTKYCLTNDLRKPEFTEPARKSVSVVRILSATKAGVMKFSGVIQSEKKAKKSGSKNSKTTFVASLNKDNSAEFQLDKVSPENSESAAKSAKYACNELIAMQFRDYGAFVPEKALKPGDKFPIGDHFLECMFHSDGERNIKQNSMTFVAIEEVAGLKLAKFEVALSFLCVSHGAPLAIKQSGQVWIHPKTNRCHKSTLYTIYTERVNRRYEHHLKTEMTITYSTSDSTSNITVDASQKQ